MPLFNFDSCPDRAGTDSTKWQRYAGTDIIPAWVADADFSVAPAIIEALKKRLDHPVFGYAAQRKETADAVIAYLKRNHGWEISREWIVFLPALVPGIHASIRAAGNAGDAALTTTPVYPPFLYAPANTGRILKTVPMIFENNRWTFDFAALDAATTPEVKIFVLSNPHNPLGRVFDKTELQQLADYAERHNLVVCSDEIHCDLVLDKTVRHTPLATLSPAIARRTISLFSASKTYNTAGLVCGFAVIPDAGLRADFRRAIAGVSTEVNVFGYIGLETAYTHGEPWREACLDYLRGNLDLIMNEVATMPGITLRQRPEATYLAWLDVSALGFENPQAAFEKGGVGLSPGNDFAGPGHVRLNFACPRDRLREILRRIRAVAEKTAPGLPAPALS